MPEITFPNGYSNGMTDRDRKAAMAHFGVQDPSKVGPPRPARVLDIQDANAGDVDALKRLLSGVARNPDGSLQDPDPKSHHQRKDAPTNTVQTQRWNDVKDVIGTAKTLSGKVPKKGLPKTPPKDPMQALVMMADANSPKDDDAALKDLKGLIDKYEKGKKGLDWSPVIALVDTWTGSNLLPAYDKPLSDEEREKIVLTLRGKLAEQEGDLAYKREYMAEQRRQAKDRMDAQASEKERDRELRLQIANIGANASAARAETAEENRHLSRKSKYLKENKNALDAIARARYGVKDEKDKSYQLHVGSVNEDIYDTGRELEQMGAAEKGQGYSMALEFYLANPSGPDGAPR